MGPVDGVPSQTPRPLPSPLGQLPGGSMLGAPVRQIALVVPDAVASATAWWEHLGIGPWNLYTIGAPDLVDMTYRGRPAPFRIRHALAFSGEVMLELVEPLDGPSIWQEYLERRGPSLHHVAIYTSDFETGRAAMEAEGWTAVQSGDGFGRSRDGRFAYFEHDAVVGVIVEVVQAPTERFPPERTIPTAG
jgi:hypothetical protein